MQNSAFWCILGSENGQLLTGTGPEGTARGEGCVGKRWCRRHRRPRRQRHRGGGVGVGRFPPPRRLRSLRERRNLPQRGPGRSPGRKRISVLSKCHRMHLFEMSDSRKLTYCEKAHSWFRKWAASDRRDQKARLGGRGLSGEGVTSKASLSAPG